MVRRKDIDGLRAIAVLSIVVFHAWPGLAPGGFTGVDIFFVISGYLISGKITEEIEQRSFSFRTFFSSRLKRLVPPLLCVSTLFLVMGYFLLSIKQYREMTLELQSGLAFVANFLFYKQSGYFDSTRILKPFLHLWSLSVEEQFYIFWPLALVMVFKRRIKLMPFYLLIFFISFLASLHWSFANASLAFFILPFRMWELVLGAMVYELEQYSDQSFLARVRQSKVWSLFGSLLGLIFISLSFTFATEAHFPGYQALLPTVGAGLLIFFRSTPITWILSSLPFNFIGLISYSLYLWHWPFLSMLALTRTDTNGNKIAVLCASLFLAALAYVGIERPLRKLEAWSPRARGIAAGSIVASLLLIFSLRLFQFDYMFASHRLQANLITSAPVTWTRHANQSYCELDKLAPIVIVGDSHANQYIDVAANSQSAIVALYQYASPPLLNVRYTARKNTTNEIFNRCLPKILEAPEVTHIVLIARLPLYLTGVHSKGEGGRPFKIDYFDSENHKISPTLAITSGYEAVVKLAKSKGKKVVLFTPTPEPDITSGDLARCLERSNDCASSYPRLSVINRTKQVDDLYSMLKAKYDNVSIFDIAKLFCDDDRCAILHDGHPLYDDADHLTDFGADYVFKAFLAGH